MSVYTRAIIEWTDSQDVLEQTFQEDFGEFDTHCSYIGSCYFLIAHDECDIHELSAHFDAVSQHEACVDIFHQECYVRR